MDSELDLTWLSSLGRRHSLLVFDYLEKSRDISKNEIGIHIHQVVEELLDYRDLNLRNFVELFLLLINRPALNL